MLYHVFTLVLLFAQAGDVVSFYSQVNVETLKRQMPPTVKSQSFRDTVLKNLPSGVLKARLTDQQITLELRRLLEPVLSLYGRNYDLIIVQSPVPSILSDSGVVVVITTAMIQQAESDDELLGYVAHEIGHEYFFSYSLYSRQLIRAVAMQGNEPLLRSKMNEVLSIIELQCDAFSAITLTHLHYDPMAFIESMERIDAKYPNLPRDNHPLTKLRRQVVEQVSLPQPHPHQSEAFKALQRKIKP
jgi:hypothetical protein